MRERWLPGRIKLGGMEAHWCMQVAAARNVFGGRLKLVGIDTGRPHAPRLKISGLLQVVSLVTLLQDSRSVINNA
jgi:hypothetical protein